MLYAFKLYALYIIYTTYFMFDLLRHSSYFILCAVYRKWKLYFAIYIVDFALLYFGRDILDFIQAYEYTLLSLCHRAVEMRGSLVGRREYKAQSGSLIFTVQVQGTKVSAASYQPLAVDHQL